VLGEVAPPAEDRDDPLAAGFEAPALVRSEPRARELAVVHHEQRHAGSPFEVFVIPKPHTSLLALDA